MLFTSYIDDNNVFCLNSVENRAKFLNTLETIGYENQCGEEWQKSKDAYFQVLKDEKIVRLIPITNTDMTTYKLIYLFDKDVARFPLVESNKKVSISSPWAFWSAIEFCDHEDEICFHGRLSYIDCIPYMFLDALISYYTSYVFPAITCDEEGTEFTMSFNNDGVIIVYCNNEKHTRDVIEFYGITIHDFADAVIDCMGKDLNDWVGWVFDGTDVQEEWDLFAAPHLEALNSKINQVKELKKNFFEVRDSD